MNFNQAYLMGYNCALLQGNTEDCIFEDSERKLKRAWILGYVEGLRELWELKF